MQIKRKNNLELHKWVLFFQNNQRNSNGFLFKDPDAEIEGSGIDGELKGDLDESSGSGQGPPGEDDEDVEISPNVDIIKPENS